MRSESGEPLSLAATDLSNFLNCRHRTALDLQAAHGVLHRPRWHDPALDALIRRGFEHEQRYVASLRARGLRVVDLSDMKSSSGRDAASAVAAATADAMRDGADVIVQAALRDDRWFGRPDVLLKVARESALGAWAYEPVDTKLARETSGGTILQLGLYSELLARLQGVAPECFHVISPHADTDATDAADAGGSGGAAAAADVARVADVAHVADGDACDRRDRLFREQRYRFDDYAAYFRLIRERCAQTVGSGAIADAEAIARANYPEPVDHCDVCPWSSPCRKKRKQDDHLSLVAGITGLQRRELEAHAVTTMSTLATMPVPLVFKPSRGAEETYIRVREQARVQVAARDARRAVHELIEPIEPGVGLCRLPPPSPGDLFLDIEGDRFADEGGREYLFGLVSLDAAANQDGVPICRYRPVWASTRADERRAFDRIIETIVQTWAAHPDMHVYHFAPYEPAALKRLMGRYASHEADLDRLLRAERFVDLYAVVRQGIRAGVERYSIKDLEACYGFIRRVPLPDANRHLRIVEQALELDGLDLVSQEVRDSVEGYNQDDCVSTFHLREWLEALRADAEANGTPVPRPVLKDGAPPENVDERAQRVEAMRTRLLRDVPDDASARAKAQPAQQTRWLLAYLLDWHRREDKATWWEYFRLLGLPEDDLFDEPGAVAGLEFVGRVDVLFDKRGRPTGSVIDRYRYPTQEMELRKKGELRLKTEETWGEVVDVDRAARTIDVKKGRKRADVHAAAAFAHSYVQVDKLEDAIYAIAQDAADDRLHPLIRTLLEREPPRLREGADAFDPRPGETPVARAVRLVCQLDRSLLAIQGPPGAGKTFTGAEMICALIAQGKRVGVTANSHAVIRNLLDAAIEAAPRHGVSLRCAHKCDAEDYPDASSINPCDKNEEVAALLASREANVVGGTAWLWADPRLAASVDVLFVDEAGQMALANVVAIAQATDSLVLLGDPQQLEQPKKGTHPDGVGVSALQHLLDGHQTIPESHGLFLPETWRLAPRICQLTSELFYDHKLTSRAGLEHQRLAGGPFDDGGLWIVEVEHDGNRNASDEEVDTVVECVRALTAPGSMWIDAKSVAHHMTGADILVVAPFNAQVGRLAERLDPLGVRAGTVDKFQGQEAPVVIYSMATSRPEDAPRGLEFLYSPNRLNVATSRARCGVVLVASPRLFTPDCRTPRQMQLANALCRYRELARSRSLALSSAESLAPA